MTAFGSTPSRGVWRHLSPARARSGRVARPRAADNPPSLRARRKKRDGVTFGARTLLAPPVPLRRRHQGLNYNFSMDPFECKLAEQVRVYKHLYDPSLRAHRDSQVALKSWREIATTLQREEAFCRKVWKNTRDRFVKAKKRTRGKGGVNKGVPSILVELEWLSRFVKHREADNNFNLEDDGAELNNRVQRTPGNFDTRDSTGDDPPVSSSAPGTPSPSPYSACPSAEMTSCGSPSPSLRDSPSPLTLLTAAATQSIHSGLLSPVPHHVPSPKASASPRTTDCVLCAVHQDQERQKMTQQDNADSRFVEVIKDMLANVNPVHKPDVKFKIYQLLFEAEKDFPRES